MTGSISDVTEVQQARVHGWNQQAWDRGRQHSRTTEEDDSYMETHKLKREEAHPTPWSQKGQRQSETQREENPRKW